MDLALRKADETGADIVLGTDPDADRVGLAIRNKHGKMILLNDNYLFPPDLTYSIELRSLKWQTNR